MDRYTRYIVAAPTTKERWIGQRTAKLLYRNWFTVFGPIHELIPDKGSAIVSYWFKTFCHLQGVHKAEPGPTSPRVMDERRTPADKSSTSWQTSIDRVR